MKKHYFPSTGYTDKKHDSQCPDRRKFFTQFVVEETFQLPEDKPDIEQIVSTIVEPQIISLKVINTLNSVSAEGQRLTGKKIVAEIQIKQKILYVADAAAQSVHVTENEVYQSAYVIVPARIEGTELEVLLKNKHLKHKIFVEDVVTREMDARTIFKNIYLFLEFFLEPTYELCSAFEYNCHNSNLFIHYQDGSHSRQLTFHKNHKCLYPQWSPNGQEIAFLSDEKGSAMLYVMTLRNQKVKCITDPAAFTSISSYCWAEEGRKMLFTSAKGGVKEIFCMDMYSLEWSQLTYGHSTANNYNPKCSPCGTKISFLKSLSGNADLYVMDNKGLNCRRITTSGHVKSYDWSADGEMIAYIRSMNGKSDEVCIVDIHSSKENLLRFPDGIIEKRKVQFSPDQEYIAVIGSDLYTDDIFIYDRKHEQAINLTKHFHNVKISDFVWNMDSSHIYFSSNELFYDNIYCVSIKDCCRQQLTNTTSSRIQLSYRPRIK